MKNTKTTEQTEQGREANADASAKADASTAQASPALSEKQRRELWTYIAVSIVAVELLVASGAVLYGFMMPGVGGGREFSFPWLSWGAVAVLVPTCILLLVHFADVGLFRPSGMRGSESEWQEHLPERMQRIYRIVKGAPVVVVLLGIIALGIAVMTLDGALSSLARLGGVLAPYIPHIMGAIVLLAAIFTGASAWLSYRTRKLAAEYEFRRQVLEKTGVIIVDKGSSALPPGGMGNMPLAIAAGEEEQKRSLRALPEVREAVVSEDVEGQDNSGVTEGMVITAEAHEVPPSQKPGKTD